MGQTGVRPPPAVHVRLPRTPAVGGPALALGQGQQAGGGGGAGTTLMEQLGAESGA